MGGGAARGCDVTKHGLHLGFYQAYPTPPPPTPVSPRVEIKPIVERPPAGAPS